MTSSTHEALVARLTAALVTYPGKERELLFVTISAEDARAILAALAAAPVPPATEGKTAGPGGTVTGEVAIWKDRRNLQTISADTNGLYAIESAADITAQHWSSLCNGCMTATHCAFHQRCLAECTPAEFPDSRSLQRHRTIQQGGLSEQAIRVQAEDYLSRTGAQHRGHLSPDDLVAFVQSLASEGT